MVVSTYSEWYERFTQGCRKRMSRIYKPDLALTLAVMVLYLEIVQQKVNDATDELKCH